MTRHQFSALPIVETSATASLIRRNHLNVFYIVLGFAASVSSACAITMEISFFRSINLSTRAVVRTLLGMFGLILCSSSCLAGSLPPVFENFIAFTFAPSREFTALSQSYGPENATFSYNGAYGSSGWTNSFSSSVNNQSYSVNYLGSYNSSLDAVSRTGSGNSVSTLAGSNQIPTSGNLVFTSGDTFGLALSGNKGLNTYEITGAFSYNYLPGNNHYFTHTFNKSYFINNIIVSTVNVSKAITPGPEKVDAVKFSPIKSISVFVDRVYVKIETFVGYTHNIAIDEVPQNPGPNTPPIPSRGGGQAFIVPEIDPGSTAGALTLLVVGVFTLTGRGRRKTLPAAVEAL